MADHSTDAQGSTTPDTQTWRPASEAPERMPLLTRINDERGIRNEQVLTRRGRLWWCPDGSMYVYYTPTEWSPAGEIR